MLDEAYRVTGQRVSSRYQPTPPRTVVDPSMGSTAMSATVALTRVGARSGSGAMPEVVDDMVSEHAVVALRRPHFLASGDNLRARCAPQQSVTSYSGERPAL